MKNIIAMFFLITALSGCYTAQDIDLGNQNVVQLAVEGNLVFNPLNPNKIGGDTIYIRNSTPYVAKNMPENVSDATLTMSYSQSFSTVVGGNTTTGVISMTDVLINIGEGRYVTNNTILIPGSIYQLSIKLANGESYKATTNIPFRNCDFRGLPQKDTCRRSATPIGVIPKGPFVDIEAYDPVGSIPDCYWFKSYVRRINKKESPYAEALKLGSEPFSPWRIFRSTQRLALGFNFSNGSQNTSVEFEQNSPRLFIMPLRLSALMSPNSGGNTDFPFYYPGDSVKLQIYAITFQHLDFLGAIDRELNNGSGGGLSGLFSRPPSNAPTNIINDDPKGKKAVGWFGGSMIAERKIQVNPNFSFIKNQSNPEVAKQLSCP